MADINEPLNAQLPLLSIPTELLQTIVALIPAPIQRPWRNRDRYWPVWHADPQDTTMLIPVCQVCKRRFGRVRLRPARRDRGPVPRCRRCGGRRAAPGALRHGHCQGGERDADGRSRRIVKSRLWERATTRGRTT